MKRAFHWWLCVLLGAVCGGTLGAIYAAGEQVHKNSSHT